VFSFAGIVLHTFTQEWPSPSEQVQFDPKTRNMVALSEVERRQQYLDQVTGEAEILLSMIMECLANDPAKRPKIADLSKKLEPHKVHA